MKSETPIVQPPPRIGFLQGGVFLCKIPRRQAGPVQCVRVGSGVEQRGDHSGIVGVACRQVQGCQAVLRPVRSGRLRRRAARRLTAGLLLVPPPPCAGVPSRPPSSVRSGRLRRRAARRSRRGCCCNAAAQCRGAKPSPSRAFGSAPPSSSAAITAGLLLSTAAECRGVMPPSVVRAFGSAPPHGGVAVGGPRPVQGRHAASARSGRLRRRAAGDHGGVAVAPRRHVQGCQAVPVPCVRVGSAVEQRGDHGGVAVEQRAGRHAVGRHARSGRLRRRAARRSGVAVEHCRGVTAPPAAITAQSAQCVRPAPPRGSGSRPQLLPPRRSHSSEPANVGTASPKTPATRMRMGMRMRIPGFMVISF